MRSTRLQTKLVMLIAAAATILLLAAACGGSSSDDDGGENTAPTATNTTAPATDTPDTAPEPTATATMAPTMDSGSGGASDDDIMNSPSLPTTVNVTAADSFFDVEVIEAPANTEFTVILFNDGALPHNISFLTEEGGSVLGNGDAQGSIILEGETSAVTFTTPVQGTYYFNCTVHPIEMTGTFIVK